MSSSMSEKYEQCLKYISSNIGNYTKPELFKLWVWDAVENVADLKDVTKISKNFYELVNVELRKIEKSDDYSLKEKLQMVFIFSRAVSNDFVKRLTDNGYNVTLNKKNVITFVESSDKTFCRLSFHAQNNGRFKGQPVTSRRQPTAPIHPNSSANPPVPLPSSQGPGSGRSSSKRAQARTTPAADSKRSKPTTATSPNASSSPYRTPSPPRMLPMTHRSADSATQTITIPPRAMVDAATMTEETTIEEKLIESRALLDCAWFFARQFRIANEDLDLFAYIDSVSKGHQKVAAYECDDLISTAILFVKAAMEPANNDFSYYPFRKFLRDFYIDLVEPLHKENGYLLEKSMKLIVKEVQTHGESTDVVSRDIICSALKTLLDSVTDNSPRLLSAYGKGSGRSSIKLRNEKDVSPTTADSKRSKPATDSKTDAVMNEDDTIEIYPAPIPFMLLPTEPGMVKIMRITDVVWNFASECKINASEIDIVKHRNNLSGHELLTASECNDFIVNAITAIRGKGEPATSFHSGANFLPLVKCLRDFTECFIKPLDEIHGNILGDSLDYMNEQLSELGDLIHTNVVPRKEIRSILVRILETVTPKEFQEPVLADKSHEM
ncbi:Protein CBG07663 [Caenorhabditis briggsae]|uniref:Protein CBG07663 n=1 Tax=Caenorhabditis briggsae TaxID=6238 RepID=A8X4C2_CAEBR|nr:Protein CBG07663 [Caenorhabditis briggsae]CAP27482.2 Protein CBG07663 [Caenorhabditis briggsae]